MQTDELKRQKVNICDNVWLRLLLLLLPSTFCDISCSIGIEGTCSNICILCEQKRSICHSLNNENKAFESYAHTHTPTPFIWIGDAAWANTQCCQRKITSRLKWGYQYSLPHFSLSRTLARSFASPIIVAGHPFELIRVVLGLRTHCHRFQQRWLGHPNQLLECSNYSWIFIWHPYFLCIFVIINRSLRFFFVVLHYKQVSDRHRGQRKKSDTTIL